VEYQGTRYSGWQVQANAPRTIQGELLRAAREVLEGPLDIQGAGRTDAGVHALGQVAHLQAEGRVRGRRGLAEALNEQLPADIVVLEAVPCAPSFHARHDAVSRSYLYQVSRRRTALGKPFVWWVKDRLRTEAMAQAAGGLVGLHDFTAFADRRLERDVSTRVLLEEAAVAEAGDLILVRLRASHFLWRMVRRLVGTLVEVGRGTLSPEEVRGLLERPSPLPAQVTAPPSGLFLEEVIYPGEVWRRPLGPVMDVITR
jgi:tRNA pseudouridine38-40 synthase